MHPPGDSDTDAAFGSARHHCTSSPRPRDGVTKVVGYSSVLCLAFMLSLSTDIPLLAVTVDDSGVFNRHLATIWRMSGVVSWLL
jgi:hypothetical protein